MRGSTGRVIQCCFTSTETMRLIRNRGAQEGHLDFHTLPSSVSSPWRRQFPHHSGYQQPGIVSSMLRRGARPDERGGGGLRCFLSLVSQRGLVVDNPQIGGWPQRVNYLFPCGRLPRASAQHHQSAPKESISVPACASKQGNKPEQTTQ